MHYYYCLTKRFLAGRVEGRYLQLHNNVEYIRRVHHILNGDDARLRGSESKDERTNIHNILLIKYGRKMGTTRQRWIIPYTILNVALDVIWFNEDIGLHVTVTYM